MNDQRLMDQAQRGNLDAFHQLVYGLDWPVLCLALRITGTEQAARSLYCETMLRLYAGLTAPRLECSLCLCACRIAANLCLDYLDRERARAVEGRPSRGISSVFTKLSPRERIVFELRHYQGLDLRTVSKVLDTTEEIARNVWFRAWHKLSAALASDVASNKS